MRKIRGINIYTLNEQERTFEAQYKDIINKANMEQTMFVFQLMMMSSQASQHSEDLSYKVKKRIIKEKGITRSSKTGKKWGREKTISNNMRKKIKERFNKFTAYEISQQTDIYQLVKGKKESIKLNTILKILRE